jgi:hypothetical protein
MIAERPKRTPAAIYARAETRHAGMSASHLMFSIRPSEPVSRAKANGRRRPKTLLPTVAGRAMNNLEQFWFLALIGHDLSC